MRLASLGRGARGLWQQATARLPYHLAIRLQRACVQLEGCARTQRYREVERLSRAVLPPGHAPRAVAETARSALLSSSFTGWRLRVLARSPARGPQAPVRVVGLDRLQSLRAARRGAMLVNSQFGVGICVPVALATLGYPLCSVEGMDHLRAAGLPPVPGLRILDLGPEGTFRLPLLRAAQSILEQGGLVHIAGDAYGGTGGVLLPFRGRLRRFAEGFATLAVLAEVPALPVFARLERRRGILVEILPPLPDDPAGRARRERVASLVAAYAKALEARWAQMPGEILATQLRAYASLPPTDTLPPSTPGGDGGAFTSSPPPVMRKRWRSRGSGPRRGGPRGACATLRRALDQ